MHETPGIEFAQALAKRDLADAMRALERCESPDELADDGDPLRRSMLGAMPKLASKCLDLWPQLAIKPSAPGERSLLEECLTRSDGKHGTDDWDRLAEELARAGVPLGSEGFNAISFCLRSSRLRLAKKLCEASPPDVFKSWAASPDGRGRSPMRIAIEYDLPQCSASLAKAGAPMADADGGGWIAKALLAGSRDCALALAAAAENGGQSFAPAEGKSALRIAAERGDDELFFALLNAWDAHGQAELQAELDLLWLLIKNDMPRSASSFAQKHPMSTSRRGPGGQLPIELAARQGWTKGCIELCRAGSPINDGENSAICIAMDQSVDATWPIDFILCHPHPDCSGARLGSDGAMRILARRSALGGNGWRRLAELLSDKGLIPQEEDMQALAKAGRFDLLGFWAQKALSCGFPAGSWTVGGKTITQHANEGSEWAPNVLRSSTPTRTKAPSPSQRKTIEALIEEASKLWASGSEPPLRR